MELTALLEQAMAASPAVRIQYRDAIAAHGDRAIDEVKPWLTDPALAAFAVRVIERAGAHGDPAHAARVLRSARSKVPEPVAPDIGWALARLREAAKPG